MRTGVLALAAATTLFVISGCSDDETAWIVLEFKAQNGNKAEMAFDNPSVPDFTLEECRATLPKVQSNLISGARKKVPMLRSARFVGARCVMSAGDPIKPS